MRNILLTLSYDGTDFCGWQRQDFKTPENSGKVKYVRTVQAEIEKALDWVLAQLSAPYDKNQVLKMIRPKLED